MKRLAIKILWIGILAVVLASVLVGHGLYRRRIHQPYYMHYSQFLSYLDQGRITDLRIKGQRYSGHLLDGLDFVVTGLPSQAPIDALRAHGVDFEIERDDGETWLSVLVRGLPGFSALLAVLLAAIKIPVELRRWRAQRQEERSADTAAEAAVAVTRMTIALKYISSPWRFSNRNSSTASTRKSDAEEQRKDFGERLAAIHPDVINFNAVWAKCDVILDDEAGKLFEEIWKEFATIKSAANTYFGLAETNAPQNAEFFNQAFGTQVEKDIDMLAARAKAYLKPIARHESTTM